MARKASDLLDVFRLRPEDGEGGRQGARSGRPARKPKPRAPRPRRRPAGDEVVSISRRQLVYAGCVVVLLLALSFTLGVSVGGDEAPPATALQKTTAPAWYIVGYLAKNAILADRPVDIQEAGRLLYRRFHVRPAELHVHDLKDRWRLRLGPFPSRDAAYRYNEQTGVQNFNYRGEAPFFPPRIEKVPGP